MGVGGKKNPTPKHCMQLLPVNLLSSLSCSVLLFLVIGKSVFHGCCTKLIVYLRCPCCLSGLIPSCHWSQNGNPVQKYYSLVVSKIPISKRLLLINDIFSLINVCMVMKWWYWIIDAIIQYHHCVVKCYTGKGEYPDQNCCLCLVLFFSDCCMSVWWWYWIMELESAVRYFVGLKTVIFATDFFLWLLFV